MMKPALKKIYYLSSTHWDREWYRSFQGFRYRLIPVLNKVLDVLEEDERFQTFTLDGQTIVLDDFCKIEPKQKERLMRLIQTGRIQVGPWYVMPDEFLVSGESLIQNLLIGNRLAKSYGADSPMKYGYICDIFGHIAQMPQIFSQFGIKGALLGRGTNLHTTQAHFIWEAPNGSRCTTFKVPEECGYGTFWYAVWLQYFLDGREDLIVEHACAYIESERERSDLPYVVLMDGMDHEGIHERAPWLAKELERIYQCPVVFEPLDHLPQDLAEYESQMQVKHGELNETAKRYVEHNMLITNTLSSRYDIKKENDKAQSLLEKWAQPLAAFAGLKGRIIPQTYLDEAYRYIVKCHAHDSICGCSIDEVHQDMHYRFRQAKAIGQEVVNDAIISVSHQQIQDTHSDEYLLTLINPLPFARDEVVSAEIWFQPAYPRSYCEQAKAEFKNAFRLFDSEGAEVSYVITDLYRNKFVTLPNQGYRQQRDCYTISFQASMQPCSVSEFKVIPSDTPVRCLAHLSTGFHTAENESIALFIENNGTVTLTDKQTGKTYRELLSFIDDSDIGDGWFHANPINERSILSRGFSAAIEKLYDHEAVCCFRITSYMQLPETCNHNPIHWQRGERDKVLKLSSELIFYKDKRYIDVKTVIDNTIKDHRLRLLLPTGISGGEYEASQAFCFVKRKVGIDTTTAEWKESEKYEKQFENILLKRDKDGDGIAFISSYGLHECAGMEDANGTLAVTLFRSFSQTFLTNGEPDGQLQGSLMFEYRIQLLAKSDSYGDLMRTKDTLQAKAAFFSLPVKKGYQPVVRQLFADICAENVVISMMKRPEDGVDNCVIVRMANYSAVEESAKLHFIMSLKQAYETNLLEEPVTEVPFTGNNIILSVKPWEIKTVRLYFGS